MTHAKRLQPFSLSGYFSSAYRYCMNNFEDHHKSAPMKIPLLCWTSAGGYLVYWMVWTWLIPQEYENLPLRLACTALAIVFLLKPFWPAWLQRRYYPAAYVMITIFLPFFFTYMMLFSGMTDQTVKSALAAFFFTLLLFDLLNVIISTMLGATAAAILFHVDGGSFTAEQWLFLYETMPIMAFAFWGMIILTYDTKRIHKNKLAIANMLAAIIAHEMRTSLAGINLNAQALINKMTAVLDKQPETSRDTKELMKAVERIGKHVSIAQQVIDLMLERGNPNKNKKDVQSISAKALIEDTLDQMTFQGDDRRRIDYKVLSDFQLRGNPTLLRQGVANLISNALKAIHAKRRGSIRIKVFTNDDNAPCMEFWDSGIGIEKKHMTSIFRPWFTRQPNGISGSGLGLPFVKEVFEQVGGKVSVKSNTTMGTVFRITFSLQDPSIILGKAA